MAFEDSLRPGTLAGVPIYMDAAIFVFGTRVVINEKPGGDGSTTGVETVGKVPHRFSMTAFVIGPDYLIDKELLIEAIDRGTAMTLEHPTRGEFQVKHVGEASAKEKLISGRLMCEFPLNLVIADPTGSFVQVTTATDVEVKAAIIDVKFFTEQVFADKWNGGLIGLLTDLLNDGASLLNKIDGKIASKMSLISDLRNAIDRFKDNVDDLLGLPGVLAGEVNGLMLSIYDLLGLATRNVTASVEQDAGLPLKTLRDAYRRVRTFVADNPAPEGATTMLRQEEALDLAATARLFAVAGIMGACSATVDVQVLNASLASDTLAELVTGLDEALATAAIDDEYAALMDLKAAIVAHLGVLIVDLPTRRTVATRKTTNALVLAHHVTGSGATADAIMLANDFPHPLFVPLGTEVEIVDGG